MEKIIMYNHITGEVLITQAKIDGPTYQGYLNKSYKAIATVKGFNVVVSKLNNAELINLNEEKS